MLRAILSALLLLSCAQFAIAAGTVVVTEEIVGPIKKVKFAWTSDSSGDADASSSTTYSGKIIGFVTDPDGAAAPTDNYDITITDQDGVDVLVGAGADRDTANTEQVVDQALLGVVVEDTLTLTVSNAGSAKSGVAIIFIR